MATAQGQATAQQQVPGDRLAAYLGGGAESVEGWLDAFSARAIACLGKAQTGAGVTGSVGEIGIHHGRLFILLRLLATPAEKSFAIDLFGDQGANVDRSGLGNEAAFRRNLATHAGGEGGVAIISGDSNRLTPEDIRSAAGPVRLMSIDGGHTAETTANDLRLADSLLVPGGIAILDDYFNPLWPDVATGAATYFLSPGARLRPFLVTPGKVFLAAGDPGRWVAAIARDFAWRRVKDSMMFGAPVAIYGFEPEGTADRLKQRLASGPLGPYLRPVWRQVKRMLPR